MIQKKAVSFYSNLSLTKTIKFVLNFCVLFLRLILIFISFNLFEYYFRYIILRNIMS